MYKWLTLGDLALTLVCKYSIEVLAYHYGMWDGMWGNLVPTVLLAFGVSAEIIRKVVFEMNMNRKWIWDEYENMIFWD